MRWPVWLVALAALLSACSFEGVPPSVEVADPLSCGSWNSGAIVAGSGECIVARVSGAEYSLSIGTMGACEAVETASSCVVAAPGETVTAWARYGAPAARVDYERSPAVQGSCSVACDEEPRP